MRIIDHGWMPSTCAGLLRHEVTIYDVWSMFYHRRDRQRSLGLNRMSGGILDSQDLAMDSIVEGRFRIEGLLGREVLRPSIVAPNER